MCEFETTEEIEQRRSESERIARLTRIEARFERFAEANLKSGCDSVSYWDDFPVLWKMAEEAESFLESKRAEVKDGK